MRTAIRLAPRPEPDPHPAPEREFTKTTDQQGACYRIRLPHDEAAVRDAAVKSHQDALVAESTCDQSPFPTAIDGFMSLVEAGWDTDVARRPHGQRTTVVVHLDLESRVAALHLGPSLSDADRRYLACDATCEVWFERDGQPLGVGRATRTVSRRLRRVLEHRDRGCVVPGCGSTRGLHAHHIQHWEDGGLTEPANLVLVCPCHHRAHHRGAISISGSAGHLVITDADGTTLQPNSLTRPPTGPPPDVAPYAGPTGERADWWWYSPFQAPPPSAN